MIKKTERKRLKKYLGNKWVDEVIEELNANNVLSAKGVPFPKNFISQVFTGRSENKEIEIAIISVAKKKKEETEALKELKKSL